MLDSLKGLLFTFFILTFIVVGLSQAPQLQGMPIEAQLANIANTTLLYIRELLSPLVDLYYRYF